MGTLRITLYLPGIGSLKEKRRIVKGLKDRIHARFNVSVAESDHQDLLQKAELGVAVVGNETPHLRSVLDHVLSTIEMTGDLMVTDVERELL